MYHPFLVYRYPVGIPCSISRPLLRNTVGFPSAKTSTSGPAGSRPASTTSSINNIPASSTNACALASRADFQYRCVRSFSFAVFLYPSLVNSRLVLERFGHLGLFAIPIYLGFEGLVFTGVWGFCIVVWRAIREAMTKV